MQLLKPMALLLALGMGYVLYFAVQDFRGTQAIQLSKKLFVDFEFDPAIAMADQAVALNPLDAEVHLNKAYVQGILWVYRKENTYREAMEAAYQKAQVLNPRNAYYHYLQANVYFDGGMPALSIPSINKAIALDPHAGAYLYEKGRYLEALNQTAEALKLYQRAYQLVKNPTIAQDIQRLGGKP